uniref:Major facilitator superfamily (MFS) profile domain-containing protein n=1 Tax=Homalodisca liturata TaxID=320908 RepID=A0A1B6JQC3_9HEMI
MDSTAKISRTHLYTSAAILNLVYLVCGTTYAWSSPVLMKLHLSDEEGSTVASMVALGMGLGPFLSGALLKVLGRKSTVGLGMVTMTCSYLLLTVTQQVVLLVVARLLAGITLAVAFSAVPTYIAEIAEDSVRGILNTFIQTFFSFGSLVVYAVGPFVSYSVLHYIMLAMCACFFLLFPYLPNSPYALIMKGEEHRAREALAWLRQGRSEVYVEKELQSIQKSVRQSQAEAGSVLELFTNTGNRRALSICCVLLALQQFSGISIIYFYTESIFKMSGTAISSSTCAIIIGIIMCVSSFLSPVTVQKFGYKTSLLISTSGCVLGMGSLGIFFLLKANHFNVDSVSWLPLLSVVTYILFFNAGFATVPWALSGELFPNNMKPYASTLVTSTGGVTAFISSKLFPTLTVLIGIEFLFLACSFFCFLVVAFVLLVVQDTSGMSFEEIQATMNSSKRKEVLRNQTI